MLKAEKVALRHHGFIRHANAVLRWLRAPQRLIPLLFALVYVASVGVALHTTRAEETDENGWRTVTQADGKVVRERVSYYLHDQLGGIEVVLDEEGRVRERQDYLPYGEERLNVGVENEEAYGFTGKERDAETGLYYYGARYYDPASARFTSPDPVLRDESAASGVAIQDVLTDPQNLNPYSYGLNNPVKYVDETGENPVLAAVVAVTAFVGAFMGSTQDVNAPAIGDTLVPPKDRVQLAGNMLAGEIIGGLGGAAVSSVVKAVGKPIVELGLKTVRQLRRYRQLIKQGVDPGDALKMVTDSSNVSDAQRNIGSYLGENPRRIQNPDSGNVTYQSEDGLREVRFDVGDPWPHENVHTHVVEYSKTSRGKELIDKRSAYPSDVDPK